MNEAGKGERTLEATGETAGLRQTLLRLRGRTCADCAVSLCDHWLLCAIALGLKDAPRCAACAARGLSRSEETMRADLARWLSAKNCFSRVWTEADTRRCPDPCAWVDLLSSVRRDDPLDDDDEFVGEAVVNSHIQKLIDKHKETSIKAPISPPLHDFGDMACGELVLELRRRMREMEPGAVIRVIATDPAAPEDIPAWARLCGHTLLAARPPHYDLRKRLDH